MPIVDPYSQHILGLEQQRKTAELLRQQGMQAPQAQMVGGVYVPPSWTQYLAQGLKSYIGGQGVQRSNKQEQKIMNERNQALTKALRTGDIGAMAQVDPSSAVSMANARNRSEPLVKVIGPNGKPIYVKQSAAAGMQPYTATTQGQRSYYQAVPYIDAQGRQHIGSFNARTGNMEPVNIGGGDVVKSNLSPTVQGRIEGAKTSAKEGVKRGFKAKDVKATIPTKFAPLDRMSSTVDDILASPGLESRTGYSSFVPASLQGTKSLNTQAKMETLKSQIAQNVLQMYRNMSATGGAVGQVSDAEQKMFQNNLAALDQSQSIGEFKKQLKKIKDFVDGSKQRILNAYQEQYGSSGNQSAPQTAQQPSNAPSGRPPLESFVK